MMTNTVPKNARGNGSMSRPSVQPPNNTSPLVLFSFLRRTRGGVEPDMERERANAITALDAVVRNDNRDVVALLLLNNPAM